MSESNYIVCKGEEAKKVIELSIKALENLDKAKKLYQENIKLKTIESLNKHKCKRIHKIFEHINPCFHCEYPQFKGRIWDLSNIMEYIDVYKDRWSTLHHYYWTNWIIAKEHDKYYGKYYKIFTEYLLNSKLVFPRII